MQAKINARAAQTDQILKGHGFQAPSELIVQFDDRVFETVSGPNGVQVNGNVINLESSWKPGDLFFYGYVDGSPTSLSVDVLAEGFSLTGAGARVELAVRSPRAQELKAYMPEKADSASNKALVCPMPGVLISVNVEEGQAVKAGEALAVVEAMKMENILRAEKDATVTKVLVAQGDKLAVDDIILEFE